MDILIKQSSIEGDYVCDPFMGSGSVAVSAIQLKRNFIGNDLSADAIEHTTNRLSHIDIQF